MYRDLMCYFISKYCFLFVTTITCYFTHYVVYMFVYVSKLCVKDVSYLMCLTLKSTILRNHAAQLRGQM